MAASPGWLQQHHADLYSRQWMLDPGQRSRVGWFDSTWECQEYGPVAHLGEQDLCKVKVAGRSPVWSTKF